MYGLTVNSTISLSGRPSIINKMGKRVHLSLHVRSDRSHSNPIYLYLPKSWQLQSSSSITVVTLAHNFRVVGSIVSTDKLGKSMSYRFFNEEAGEPFFPSRILSDCQLISLMNNWWDKPCKAIQTRIHLRIGFPNVAFL